ncbi:YceI family protein [Flavobacterium sp. NRK F10]|uniref:YceI family protein n=1 Tax=Flavobacterium sediminis TaxID=2201181 RepID=A0A2U8QX90_9FLAO|nr:MULTISPECIES: YceI family protein [Flavobacterium]AWM14832.1 YceI family protein [Flavobacterium sediminis]MCO6176074.1 YceI family protein [Flavobacterium sp. NRK F10]
MKANLKSIALALVAFVTFSTTAQTTKKVNVEKSKLHWVGKKVTGQHEGTISLKEGAVVLKGKKLVGGNFTVDMTSINTTDLEGDWKAKLDGHLKAEDFFGVEKFPTSTLVFKKIADKGNGVYTVYADLTIKGITQPVNFDLTVNGNSATGKLVIDRTKFGIKYGSGSFFSGLGDKTIYDEFELDVTLSF